MEYESKVTVEFDGEEFVLPIRTPTEKEAMDIVHSMPDTLDEMMTGDGEISIVDLRTKDLNYVRETVTEHLVGARRRDVESMSVTLQVEIFVEILDIAFDDV